LISQAISRPDPFHAALKSSGRRFAQLQREADDIVDIRRLARFRLPSPSDAACIVSWQRLWHARRMMFGNK
jgi:hypothetical protein